MIRSLRNVTKEKNMAQKIIKISDPSVTLRIFGSFDKNVSRIENEFAVKIFNRQSSDGGDGILIEGDDHGVNSAGKVINYLKKIASFEEELTDQNVDYIVNMVKDGKDDELSAFDDGCLFITAKGKPIKAKTVGQKRYIEMISKNTVVLGTGPAGTGKTYLAVMMAVRALRNREVSRIILTRPAVEAGERLGFLPGDLQSKIDPYLRPLYDALYDMLGPENCMRMIEKMIIEIAPLAYMRGRTLDDSFIILDEAQNSTPEQMKMFLTRLGNNSKIVVTGDLTQTDLPFGQKSGLAAAVRILRDVEGIGIFEFSDRDVVRHRLVQKIILAYDKYDRERRIKEAEKNVGKDRFKVRKKPR